MRWLLILPIRVYRLIPARFKKRRCLFRETCSRYVMRTAAEDGLLAGCRALRLRAARCRPRYTVNYHHPAREWRVTLADGTSSLTSEVADFIVEPYRAAAAAGVAAAEAHLRGIAETSSDCKFRLT